LAQIQFQHDRIYSHQTLKINYTTYDIRCAQDIVSPHTVKHFILIPSDEEADPNVPHHPFWYAKVLGIYHANVSYRSERPKRMDFLWVQWLGRSLDTPGSWDDFRLDQVRYFTDSEHAHAFEFIDPMDVIRAAHLIPRFASGQTLKFLGPGSSESVAADDQSFGDWEYYYVNR
jgi:hypothetical protein